MTEEKHIETALIKEINTFCERHSLAFTTFGRRFLSNPNFYNDLLDGRSPTGKTLKRLRVRMKNENIKLRGKKNVEQ